MRLSILYVLFVAAISMSGASTASGRKVDLRIYVEHGPWFGEAGVIVSSEGGLLRDFAG